MMGWKRHMFLLETRRGESFKISGKIKSLKKSMLQIIRKLKQDTTICFSLTLGSVSFWQNKPHLKMVIYGVRS